MLIDPFLTGNPKAAATADEVDATTILLTHGHGDHVGDTVAIAKRTGAPVVAIVEIANELGEEGVDVFDPNIGGTVTFDWGWVRLDAGLAHVDHAEAAPSASPPASSSTSAARRSTTSATPRSSPTWRCRASATRSTWR